MTPTGISSPGLVSLQQMHARPAAWACASSNSAGWRPAMITATLAGESSLMTRMLETCTDSAAKMTASTVGRAPASWSAATEDGCSSVGGHPTPPADNPDSPKG